MKGTVKFFNEKKGFGFIGGDDGKDYFVYYRDIKKPGFKVLVDGEKVSFEAGVGEKGPIARNVLPE